MIKNLCCKQTLLLKLILIFVLLLTIFPTPSAQAGDPLGGVIGPMNPTMYKCVRVGSDGNPTDTTVYDPWKKPRVPITNPDTPKPTARPVAPGGDVILFGDAKSNTNSSLFDGGVALLDPEFRAKYLYDALSETCDNALNINFGFDTKDAAAYEAYVEDLRKECKKGGGEIHPIAETKIEGKVYEFHPGGENGSWFGVPSRDVPVEAEGITFKIEWGSNTEGYYYFKNLGAGPIVLNLRLPPDAHPINPNVIIFSSGLESGYCDYGATSGDCASLPYPWVKPPWTVMLGFYRGDVAPPDVAALRMPDGNALPFSTLTDLRVLNQCGYRGTPTGLNLPPEILDMSLGIPSVGGVLPADRPASVILLSVGLLMALLIAGIWKLPQ